MKRVAVIGVGIMGKNHARVYSDMPDVELVAVSDANPALADFVGKAYHIPAYLDYQEMIQREHPEAVSVTTPASLHYRVTADVLKLGCHVIVEKPIAANAEEALGLSETAERMGRVLMVGHVERFNPAIIELKRRLERNELGEIFQVRARRLGPFPIRLQDADAISDLALHDLDVMRYLTGSEVSRMHAETKRIFNKSQDDMFVSLIRFSNGTIGMLEINWLTPTKIRELYIAGERGMFLVNYITQDLYFLKKTTTLGKDWSTINLSKGINEGLIVQYPIQKKEPLRAELENFISCVHDFTPEKENGRDAHISLDVIGALMESARNGRTDNVNYLLELDKEALVFH